jgi:uncharacterized protein
MNGQGLNDDGTIARKGAPDRVPAVFVPVGDAVRACITETFGPRMHGAYPYGNCRAIVPSGC